MLKKEGCEKSRMAQKCLLLVEDNPDQVDLVKRVFLAQPNPPKIIVAQNGTECLGRLSEEHFSAFLLDYSLPGMASDRVYRKAAGKDYTVTE